MISIPDVRPVNDGLEADLEAGFQQGYYWRIPNLVFYFRNPDNPPDVLYYEDDWTAGSFRSLGETDRVFVREILDYASRIFGLTFSETSSQSGNLSFGSHLHTVGGYAGGPGKGDAGTSVDIEGNSDFMSGGKQADVFDHPGRFTYGMLIHEIGHALGLSPIQGINGYLVDSVMGGGTVKSPISFGVYDVLVLQERYGAVIDSTNDRYYLRSTEPETTARVFEGDVINLAGVFCLYDGGGTNTIDLSLNDTPSVLDMRPGSYSIVGAENASQQYYNFSIAYNSRFHDLVGSDAGDIIFGNDLGNSILCGAGDDSVAGLAGDDIMDGGGGFDIFVVRGDRAEYGISRAGATVYLDGPDGRDELRNVEGVQFDDMVIDIVDTVRPLDDKGSKIEGNGGTTSFSFLVSLPYAADTSVSRAISYSISGWGERPADASDFSGGTFPSGTLTFAAGESSRILTVDIVGDSYAEGDETFGVSLSDPVTGQAFEDVLATATIATDDQASVRLSAPSVREFEGNGGTTAFTFFVELDRPSEVTETLSWDVFTWPGVVSTDATDFAGSPFSGARLTFAPGETTKTIAVDVAGDAAVEPDELFFVHLHSPSAGLNIVSGAVEATILDDDSSRVFLDTRLISQPEGDTGTTAFSFPVFLTQASPVAQTVRWSISSLWADGADFSGGVLPSGTVTFAAGETDKTIVVEVGADSVAEASELFTLALSDASSGLSIGLGTATGSIVDDDLRSGVIWSVKTEGSSGATEFTFELQRSGLTSVPGSIAWWVTGSGQNPADASDFLNGILPSGAVTFASGETSKIITVLVAGDSVAEANEEFAVRLSGPSIGTQWFAAGVIQDDDTSVSVQATVAAKAEGQAGTTAFTFTLTRSGRIAESHSVAWAVTGAAADPAGASDFAGGALPTGMVTFESGETSKVVTVNVAGDTGVEADEGFTVTLSNPSAGLTIGAASASGTIQNDDTAPPVAAHGDAYVAKQGQLLAPTQPLSTGVLANDGNAAAASLLDGPDHGTLQLAGDGTFTYTPAAGFHGIDSFTYRAGNAGATTDEAQVTLHVVPVSAGLSPTLDLVGLTAEEQIAATYAAFFGRGADAEGFDFWVGQFVSGMPQGPSALFANIAISFAVSAEAKGLYPFLVDPLNASDGQIASFLNSVYDNLFNRTPDAGGLGYWTDQVKQTLQAGQFVGSVLVNIMSGAQDTAAGQDITTLMGKVAVSLAYVREQHEHPGAAGDMAAAKALLEAVTADPVSVLVGVWNAESLIAGDI